MLEAGALHQLQTTSSHYATVCSNANSPPDDCTAFGRQMPTWNSSILTDYCPFADGMCLQNTTFAIESGEMDSALVLGINTPPEDRLSIKLTKECAPITTDGYVKHYTARNISSLYPPELPAELRFGYSMEGLAFDAFFYGPNLDTISNATFVFNNGTFQTSSGSFGDNPSYYLE